MRYARFALLAALALPAVASAQQQPPEGTRPQQETQGTGPQLGTGPYARMHYVWEATIFNVDALAVDIQVDQEAASKIEAAVQSGKSDQSRDAIVQAVLDSQVVRITVHFLHGADFNRFIKDARKNLDKARDAGIISDATYEEEAKGLPEWYAGLEGRGVKKGDVMTYSIHGDQVRVHYVASGGQVLVDNRATSAERRHAVIGGWLAPKTDFRDGLIKSLYR